MNIADAMIEAERKAWKSLAGYKFLMFGYHAAQWVLLNKLDCGFRMKNPFRGLVKVARGHVAHLSELESEYYDGSNLQVAATRMEANS
jgi:hypothetical protein